LTNSESSGEELAAAEAGLTETIDAMNEKQVQLVSMQEKIALQRDILAEQTERLESVTEFLQDAENTRAAAELAKDRAAFTIVETAFNEMKTELDTLFEKDN
jgi:hypothetical protein